MHPQSLEDLGLDAPTHNGKVARVVAEYVPDRLPFGEELAMMHRKCDEFLAKRGYVKMTKAEWLFPRNMKNRAEQKKMLTKKK
jgi:hypothetical protein